ncbi:MAG: aldo/keto reductase [Actinobacteria bacterium]|nr:aldo/keto reductase [Actinomycetota bacterium]
MEYRLLGHSGLLVSRLCLGTMTFGHESDREEAFRQLDAFVEAGGNFIDTADVYTHGTSEQIIGGWLAERPGVRDQLVIATKGRFAMSPHPNGVGLSRRHLSDALDASLRRLRVDTIDLYQLHAWDPLTPIEEYLRFVDDAVSAGKISYFGLSNFTGWQLTAVVERARAHGWTAPISLQPQYNLLTRSIEFEITDAAAEYGLGLIPWSPLAGGWLTGKYSRDHVPEGASRLGENPARGMEGYERRNTDDTWRVLAAVASVADASGLTMAQVALAWLADRPGVTAPILGNRTTEQLVGSLAVADLHLDAAATVELDAASAPSLPDYPYGPMGRDQRNRTLP